MALSVALSAALVACSDVNVNDIDTTVAVPVEGITIPLNLDKVELHSFLDLDGNDKVQIIDGEYAIVTEGVIEDKEYHIEPLTIPAEPIDGVEETMTKQHPDVTAKAASARNARALSEAEAIALYYMPQMKSLIKANSSAIDAAINSLLELKIDAEHPAVFTYNINFDQNNSWKSVLNKVHINNLKFKVPLGINGVVSIKNTAGVVLASVESNSETGVIDYSKYSMDVTDGILCIEAVVTSIDHNLLDKALKEIQKEVSKAPLRTAGEEIVEKQIEINEEIGIESGEVWVYNSDFIDQDLNAEQMFESLSSEVEVATTAKMTDIVITTVSGDFMHDVDDIAIEGVDLGSMPDFLSQSGTDIHLVNPQIYIRLWNDAAQYDAYAYTDLKITTLDADGKEVTCIEGEQLAANANDNLFCLAPKDTKPVKYVLDTFQDFTGEIQYVNYQNLGELLAGPNGLPKKINIIARNVTVGGENVNDLKLDENYHIKGSYLFYSPLALHEGSVIKYSDVIDGWSKDTEKIKITKLSVSMQVSSDMPVDLELDITPVSVGAHDFNCSHKPFVVPAHASNAKVEMAVEGIFENLDGIRISACATSKDANATLTPDMKVTISDVKVKVAGTYIDKL